MTVVDGLRIVPGYLDRAAQAAMREALQDVFARAPLYTPRMPKTGRPMSVRMSNCGPLGCRFNLLLAPAECLDL